MFRYTLGFTYPRPHLIHRVCVRIRPSYALVSGVWKVLESLIIPGAWLLDTLQDLVSILDKIHKFVMWIKIRSQDQDEDEDEWNG